MLGFKFNLSSIPCFTSTIIIGILHSFSVCNNVPVIAADTNSVEPLTATAYVDILQLRRLDHRSFVKNMLKSDYSRNYKIISVAMEKIFHVFKESNQTLTEQEYSPSRGFPSESKRQEAVILILENCCLVADIILHFPEISYRVLKKIPDWRPTVNWCIGFVNLFPHIIDESIGELMNLVRQEANEEERSPDFTNPYYTKVDTIDTEVKKKRKQKNKIKRGPVLTRHEL